LRWAFYQRAMNRNKEFEYNFLIGWLVVFYATFNNISVKSQQSVLLVEETEVLGENHRPVTSH
jgi:hypothetical protein